MERTGNNTAKGLTTTASPNPQTIRSGFIGIIFRRRFKMALLEPITTTVLNNVVPLNSESISFIPIT